MLKNKWVQLLAPVLVLWLVLGISKFAASPHSIVGATMWEVILLAGPLLLNLGWLNQPIGLTSTLSPHKLMWINWYGIFRALLAIVVIGFAIRDGRVTAVLSAFVLAMFVGLTEEYIFRGMLLPLAIRAFSGKHQIFFGVMVSSILFGSTHLFNLTQQSWLATSEQMLTATAVGALFAAIYLRTGNLWFAIVTHALQDFPGIAGPSHGMQLETTVVPVIIVTGVFFIFAWLLLRKTKVKTLDLKRLGLTPMI
ncbi:MULTISPECIES: CPBP family intramembrane glutamic endopeptidase [Furfurilactobacillus]|nr:CPBP family intramembrane glutamic endopeptidase [Furfurilactobacillus milii]